MNKLNTKHSKDRVETFLGKLKKDVSKNEVLIEYFELTLQEPHYQKCECAYIQTNDHKEGLLYDAVGQHLFYIAEELDKKANKENVPVLSNLSFNVFETIPKQIREAMFWVCGNKKDKPLTIDQFNEAFKLVKPSNIL